MGKEDDGKATMEEVLSRTLKKLSRMGNVAKGGGDCRRKNTERGARRRMPKVENVGENAESLRRSPERKHDDRRRLRSGSDQEIDLLNFDTKLMWHGHGRWIVA